uniref:Genome polyprotein n=1 Tax=Encephalomyocarditis virus TaxID=12104 RepID=T1WMM5_EMCV|nr:polyprotein [Encephalomyocarditis virus]
MATIMEQEICAHTMTFEECPKCSALQYRNGFYLLKYDEEWYPEELLIEGEDDVFDPELDMEVVFETQGNSTSSDKNNSSSEGNEGVIINNFYSNQYQNSIDLSANATGNNPPKTYGQFSNLLSGAVNAFTNMLPLLNDQNTEEMENLSDRVAQDTAGNTVTNTQSTVGRLLGYGVSHNGEHPASCADTASEKILAVERYYTFKVTDWTSTQKAFEYIRIPLPHVLSGESGGVFGAALRRHYLVKTGWRVQIQCNASQVHAGSLLVFMAPEYPTLDAFVMDNRWSKDNLPNGTKTQTNKKGPFGMDHQNYWQWTLYPHQFLNLRTNTTVDLEVPYVNIAPTSSWTQHASWTLVIAVVAPLTYSTGASTSLDITASIQPVRPVFNGLRHETLQTQSPIPVTIREHAGTWYSTLPDTTVPIYGKTPVAPSNYMVGEYTDFLEIAQIPTFIGNKIPNAVPYIEATNTVVKTNPLATYQVTLSCTCLANTFLAALSRNFAQYRGSMVYTFVFTGTAMMKGKFLIAYTPPGAGKPTTRDQAMQATYAIWDLGLNSTYSFTVPFISPSHFRMVGTDQVNITNVDGWVTVWQLTPLTYPPGCPNTAKILTMVSAGKDFTVKMPISPAPWSPQGIENAEKGVTENTDATADFVAQPVYLPENQTKVNFFYDRYSPIGAFSVKNGTMEGAFTPFASDFCPNSVILTPGPQYDPNTPQARPQRLTEIWGNGNEDTSSVFPLKTKQDYSFCLFSPFVYYKCDLEVTISPHTSGNHGLAVRWSPTGTPTKPTTQVLHAVSSLSEGRTPKMYSAGPGTSNHISFVVPYNSPLSVLPAVWYNGHKKFDNTGSLGIAPNSDFGTLFFAGTKPDVKFTVYLRYKNMKVFCPRPTVFFPWPSVGDKVDMTPRAGVLMLESPPFLQRAANPLDIFQTFPVLHILLEFNHRGIEARLFRYGQYWACCYAEVVLRSRAKQIAFLTKGSTSDCDSAAEWNPWKRTYHAILRAEPHRVTLDIYHKRIKPFKMPLVQKEWRTHEENIFQLWRLFDQHYAGYFSDLLIHDVELNPGPFMFKPKKQVFQTQGAALTTMANTLAPSNIANQALGSAFSALLDANEDAQKAMKIMKTLSSLSDAWENVKDTLQNQEFWKQLLTRCVQVIAGMTIAVMHPDPLTLLCLGVMTTAEVTSQTNLCEEIVSKFKNIFRTPPPKFPGISLFQQQSPPLKNVNDVFSLAKNLDWAVRTVEKIVSWFGDWVLQEEKEQTLDEMLTRFPEHAKRISDLRNGMAAYVECKESFDFFERLYNQAVKEKRTGIAAVCEKFRQKHDHATARCEPVVIVLRGDAGQGKSLSSQIIAQAVSKTIFGRQSVYSLPPDSDFFDGYENQFAAIMDDLGQNPDGSDFTTFCQMVSTTNFLPNMASLERKGTPFTSQLVVATTNLPEFRPVTIAHYPAVERRITFDYSVSAGPMCSRTEAGQKVLDVERAFRPTGEEAPLPCFQSDCLFLNKAGIQFRDNRTKEIISLVEVIERAVAKIERKKKVLTTVQTLVAQAPVDEVNFHSVVQQLRARQEATDEQLEELQEAFAKTQERSSIFSDWMKISAMVCAATLALSQVVKMARTVKQIFKPDLVRVQVDENEQGPYNERTRLPPKTLQLLDVQGPNQTMDFEKYVAKNVTAPIEFIYPTGVRIQTCLLIKNRVLAVNRHMVETDWEAIQVRGVVHRREAVKILAIAKTGKDTDVTFLKLNSGPLFKDNVKKFVSAKDVMPQSSSPLIGIMNSEIPMMYTGSFLKAGVSVPVETGNTFSHCIHYKANTKKGWCGSAVISDLGGQKKIVGMHSAGSMGIAAASMISQEMIGAVLNVFEPQGALEQLPDGPRIHVPRKTALRPTVAKQVFQPDFAPAVLSKFDPRTEADVDTVAFSKHTSNQETLPPVFRMVAKEYANRVFSLLGKDNGKISVKQALEGMEGMDPMDRNTSPGLPYTSLGMRRTDVVDWESGTLIPFASERLENMTKGDFSGIVYQTFLKDELRPMEKVRAAKTRIVDVPPFEHCILGRQLLGKFASKFQTQPGLELGSAIGCDPDVHWTKFGVAMQSFQRVYDVDYSNFDSTHSVAMFRLLAEEFFTPENGFDPLVSQYLDSLAISTHAFEEKRYLITGGLPSGCAATSMLNTIMNNIIIRAGLYLTYKNFEFDDIQVLSYGDDLLVATDYQLDFDRVKASLAKTGYKITPANKTSSFPLESTLDDVVFLKRKFKREGPLYRPVMNKEALEAMLSYYRPGSLAEKLTSVTMLAVHSGKQEYDRLFAPFREVGIMVPQYESVEYRWRSLFW